MRVDFNGLRKNLVRSYNELLAILNQSSFDERNCELNEINANQLSDALMSLHNDIVFVAALEAESEAEGGFKSILDDPDFKMTSFKFDEDL